MINICIIVQQLGKTNSMFYFNRTYKKVINNINKGIEYVNSAHWYKIMKPSHIMI